MPRTAAGQRVHVAALNEIIRLSEFGTDKALAAALEISPGHLTDIKKGRKQPSRDLTRRIAGTLKVNLAALLLDPNDPEAA